MDLTQFCGKQERYERYGINKPFSQGGWTYATEGHVCIRVPRIQGIPEQGKPEAYKLFDDAEQRTVMMWQPLPEFVLTVEDCDYCHGKGYLKLCPRWDNPKLKCYDGDNDFCLKYSENCTIGADFKEKGSLMCEECEGKGTIEQQGNIIVDGAEGKVRVSAIFLNMIKDLPNVQIAPHSEDTAIRIKFDGGEGLLMPARIDKPCDDIE
jgi:hypothetical protein